MNFDDYANEVKLLQDTLNSADTTIPMAFPTEYPVSPTHECEATIQSYSFDVIAYTDKVTGEPRSFAKLNVKFGLNSHIAEEAKGPNPTSYLTFNVDIDANGNITPKNVNLGRFLSAVNLNKPGVPLAAMVGHTLRVQVGNVTDETPNGPVTSDYVSGIYGSGPMGDKTFYRFTRKPRRMNSD